MNMNASLRIALRALRINPLRSILTTLGVIIGVAAVITTSSIGAGARASTQAQLTALGTNLLTVFPGRVVGFGGVAAGGATVQTLTLEDAEAIAALDSVEGVSAEFSRQAQVIAGELNDTTSIMGVTPAFVGVRNWAAIEGTFFSEDEVLDRSRVALVGTTVKSSLFPDGQAVGREVRINRVAFSVIGVMETKGAAGPQDRDDVVIVPLSTAMKRLFGVDYLGAIYVKVRSAGETVSVMQQVDALLRARHRIDAEEDADFTIRNQADLVQTLQGVTQTITVLLGSVAAVSLLVGGIGIMNIMLVSVTERTREIGIRKAIGARRRDILAQFLVEAVLLSLVGGALGILAAIGIARLVSSGAGWATIVSTWSVLLAFGFAAAVGIFFGLFPAQRAAALDPIVALRSE